MSTMKIKIYEDPGHGWGAVERSLLSELGLADKISSFSYVNDNLVFLEEDCDLPKVVKALTLKGVVINYKKRTYHNRCPIRNMMPYQA